ncbi:MAG: zinc protease [Chitinophagales bacterium]|jgi:zinc protease
MNRTLAPQIQLPTQLSFGHVHQETLPNGLPLYVLDGTTQNIFQLNLLFQAGRFFESQKMLAGLCASTILKGTQTKNAAEIAESIDFYGATIKFQANMYTAQLSLFCLSEKLPQVLPLLMDVLQNATFPIEELKKIKAKSKQKLAVQWEKNGYIATQHFNQAIFGEKHAFGYLSAKEDIDAITRENVQEHYQKHFQLNTQSKALVAGSIGTQELSLLQEHLGQIQLQNSGSHHISIQTTKEKDLEIASKNTLQAAIRVGMPAINIHHPDFEELQVLNTVLGGYFGSRLMSNIREEKGFTYGIYSFINPIMDTGYFCIATEVGEQYKKQTLKEIEFEINRLRNEPIPEKELAMVKNYMIGQLMNSVDGPLSMIGTLKNFLIFGLDLNEINKQLSNIHAIEASRLQTLAQEYLDYSKMIKVVAG